MQIQSSILTGFYWSKALKYISLVLKTFQIPKAFFLDISTMQYAAMDSITLATDNAQNGTSQTTPKVGAQKSSPVKVMAQLQITICTIDQQFSQA
jgi:hypothetical protein